MLWLSTTVEDHSKHIGPRARMFLQQTLYEALGLHRPQCHWNEDFTATESYETDDRMARAQHLLTASTATGDGGAKWKQIAGTRPSWPVELHTRHLVTGLESSTTHSSPELTCASKIYSNTFSIMWNNWKPSNMCCQCAMKDNEQSELGERAKLP